MSNDFLGDGRDVVELDNERLIVSHAVNYPEFIPQLHSELQSDDFTDWAARGLFEATKRIVERGGNVDLFTVRNESAALDGAFSQVMLSNTAGMHSTEFGEIVAAVADAAARRHNIKTLRRALALAEQGSDEQEVLSAVSSLGQRTRHEWATLGDALRGFTETHLDKTRKGWIATSFLGKNASGTGLDDIIVEGYGPGELVLIGARPGMGKTSFATQMVHHIAMHYGRVAVVSLEMTKEELAGRMASQRCKTPVRALTVQQLDAVQREFAELPINFVDRPMRRSELMNQLMALHARTPLVAAVIDYGGLIGPDACDERRSEYEQFSILSKSLKNGAKRLRIPWFVLHQLKRPDSAIVRRPTMTDLRGSGTWEQDADTILFPHRPGYYDHAAPQDLAEILVAKNRDGWDGVATVEWDRNTTSFLNTDSTTWAPPITAVSDQYEMDGVPF